MNPEECGTGGSAMSKMRKTNDKARGEERHKFGA